MPLRSGPRLSAARSLSSCTDSVCWRSDESRSSAVDTMSFGPVLSSSAESEGAKRTVVDVCLRATAPKVSLATVEPPDHLTVAVAVPLDFLVPSTSRVVRRGPTWPSASRVHPGTAWSGCASRDRQRTMYVDTSPARSLSRHELLQPSSRRRLRHGGPRMDWTTPEVWTDAQLDAL